MAAAALDSPGVFVDSPFDAEDAIYPCKACGEILEEGKAYELAGNRWHIDCFRCNTCGTLLDSDANLLLLGDGSLICNNCTYSCSACGNKIEDLAILTGDQAFCSGCFRCRNCKRKIENLRYARTSQGIFCMSCHESLMARRRKKSKSSKSTQNGGSGTVKEKALPSIPPTAANQTAFTPDVEGSPVGTPVVKDAPREKPYTRKEAPSDNLHSDPTLVLDERRTDGLTLPASTYTDRKSTVSHDSDDGEVELGFLPMAFEPGPPPITRKQVPASQEPHASTQSDSRSPREHVARLPAKSAFRDGLRDEARPESPNLRSSERDLERSSSQANNTGHILHQDKGRQLKRDPSNNNMLSPTGVVSPTGPLADRVDGSQLQSSDSNYSVTSRNDGFKLEEVPDSKKLSSRTSSRAKATSPTSPIDPTSREKASPSLEESDDSPKSSINPFDDPRRRDKVPPSATSSTSRQGDRPVRGDSLTKVGRKPLQSSPDTSTPSVSTTPNLQTQERKDSTPSIPSSSVDRQNNVSRDTSRAILKESPLTAGSVDSPPPRSSSRPGAAAKAITQDEPTALRAPPVKPSPPAGYRHHRQVGSTSSLDGPVTPSVRSPALPKRSLDGTFSMEEEMVRIMKGETKKESQTSEGSTSVLRKVSNAVKHGRSFSDRGLSSAGKASANGAATPVSISSPILSSFSGHDSNESLVAQLRRAHQRIAELEAANSALQEKVDASSEIKAANNELREKRTTIVVLDTQREMVVRELEAMTEHLTKAKDSNQPLDIKSLKGEVVKDFAASLQKLKDQMSFQIEELMHKRNELTEEIGNLIQMKDKGFQEYESLSTKNAQLLEMNSQILHNIQEMYKSNRSPNGTNGLGIYHPGAKPASPGQSDVRNLNLISTDSSMPNLLQESEADAATVLNAPQVVNIRKAQPKRFNWRKGGEKMAKNVTKGIKGAFGKDENLYGQTLGPPGTDQGVLGGRQGSDAGRGGAGFGFFGQKGGAGRPGAEPLKSSGSSSNIIVDASVLFGSELEARCEYEKRVVPGIVSRCIEEVESRGMDMEGIYRKSGGAGQVKLVQAGFEKDSGYDISDPDLDIHAVTSALKQYFRKLPTPLVTFDVYDLLLDAGKLGTDNPEKQAVALRLALAELPESHHNCLEYLFQHLARVVDSQASNLMTPLNLAVVFAPTIMRPLSIEREMSDMQAQRAAVQAILELHEVVFAEEE